MRPRRGITRNHVTVAKQTSNGTLMERRDATTFRQVTATMPVVPEPMCVASARDQNPCTHVNPVLNLEAWSKALQDHPDDEFRQFILKGIVHGVDVGHVHLGPSYRTISTNWPSTQKYHSAVEKVKDTDVSRGRKLQVRTPHPHSTL